MKKFETVKEVADTVVGKIVIFFVAVLAAISIIPELLNAKSDFAVLLGLVMILSIIVCLYLYYEKILRWFGFIKDVDTPK